jgi:hypothetical protein
MESLDIQKTEIQRRCKSQSRKIKKPELAFSLPVQTIHKQREAFVNLQCWHEKKITNSHIIRDAYKAGIPNPTQLTVAKCIAGAAACRRRLKELEARADQLQWEHLGTRYKLARTLKNPKRRKEIETAIKQEDLQHSWLVIQHATGEPRMGATPKVQIYVDRKLVSILKATEMNREIQIKIEMRFNLAHSTEITRSSLGQLVRYCANTKNAKDLLQNSAHIPSSIDNATSCLIYKFQQLFKQLKQTHKPVVILPNNYCYYWGRASKKTLSAISAGHFGHWKVASKDPMLVDYICTQLNLIAQMSSAPSSWGVGLQVLLEKIPGISLVEKLQAILLMEGTFTFFNKWIFGHDAINHLYKLQYFPDDQYSQKESTTEDSKFDNQLTMDLSRQFRQVLVTISADADKCYDRINHIMMFLLLHTIVGDTGAIDAMLVPIQTMKLYQHTGRGDSNTYMGGRTTSNPLQRLCQGSSAAPACWLMKISTIMACYKKTGFGSLIIAPISGEVIKFMGKNLCRRY